MTSHAQMWTIFGVGVRESSERNRQRQCSCALSFFVSIVATSMTKGETMFLTGTRMAPADLLLFPEDPLHEVNLFFSCAARNIRTAP